MPGTRSQSASGTGMATRSSTQAAGAPEKAKPVAAKPARKDPAKAKQKKAEPKENEKSDISSRGAEEPPAPKATGGTKTSKKSSVQRLGEDMAADQAGEPAHMTRTERILENSGIPVAPPERPRDASSTIPPPPPRVLSGRVRLEEAESDESDGGAPKNVGLKKTEAKTEATTEGATELTSESESEEEEDSQARNQDDNASSTSEGEVEIIAKDDEEKGGVPDNNMDVDVDKGKDNNERVTDIQDPNTTPRKLFPVAPVVERGRSPSPKKSFVEYRENLSMSPVLMHGSSRAAGGHLRGRAQGNVFNFADKDEFENVTIPQKVNGMVQLFVSRNPNAEHHGVIMHETIDQLPPILEKLMRKCPQLEEFNCPIFVQQDGMWLMKGPFSEALEDTETLIWKKSDDGKFSLAILAEDMPTSLTRDTLSVHAPSRSASVSTGPSRSTSISASRSASAAGSRSVSAARTEDGGSFTEEDKTILATALGIPLHLIGSANRHKGDLQDSYATYVMILEGDALRRRIHKTLPKKYTLNNIILLFMSTSAYYNNSNKIFSKLRHYPEMEEWLRNEEGAPSKMSVWGSQKPTFENLNQILDDRAARSQAGSSKEKKSSSSSHKGKKRKAEDEEKDRKKKSKSKDKEKKSSKD
ncbi:hypothetical protein BD410DRAFT_833097 [Rickenella mellea]|uniref:Uncharacterized protein n=1 Tax=Rickenella mellea TaxID=50990 RepID=A0A4Y7PG36_9AGAM|nr:hypothetical protein BD410DRAFT_833097 [Rickenella mellea]